MTHTKDKALVLTLKILQINLTLLKKINPYKGQEDLLSDSLDLTHRAVTAIKQALAEPLKEPVQEPVACAVCYEVHGILDADESKIIRDAKDGYPDGRIQRRLTLQERVTALCVYAADWKRWCLEKENTTPPAVAAVPDAIRHTDLSENIEYIRGWNECRELTIQMQITSPTKQGGAA
jgi:hypothetical protein